MKIEPINGDSPSVEFSCDKDHYASEDPERTVAQHKVTLSFTKEEVKQLLAWLDRGYGNLSVGTLRGHLSDQSLSLWSEPEKFKLSLGDPQHISDFKKQLRWLDMQSIGEAAGDAR